MVKSLFETVLIILLPLLLIFAVYRYCMGYNPLNFKAVITIISDQFSSTSDYFGEFARLQSQVFKEVDFIASQKSFLFDTGFAPLDNIVEFIFKGIVNIGVNMVHIGEYIRVGSNFLFSIVGDFIGAIIALSEFIVDSSPYLIQPYFPAVS